jgi:hypothetical protein
VGASQKPLEQVATAVPVLGAVLSTRENDNPEAVNAVLAIQVLPAADQLRSCTGHCTTTGAGALQLAALGVLQVPLVHAYVAMPVLGVPVLCNTAELPEAVDTAVALQLLPPTDQLSPPALQAAGATGAVQVALVGVPHTPLVQEKLAAPVVGAAVSASTAFAPEALATTLALQVLPPAVQLRELAAQPPGAAHVAPVAAPQTPLLQAKLAAPVVGEPASDSKALAPEAVEAAAALQVLVPTVQLNADAAQATGAVHETLVGAPHTPLVHAKLAAPVVGAATSDRAAVAPEAVDAAVALHTLAPTLQLRSPEQGAAATGTAQVAEVAAPQAPLVQANVAAPVLGAVVSDNTALTPEAVATDEASHLLPPTVQLKGLAAQPTGAEQVVPVAEPHTPLLQAKLAAPVVGAAVSDSKALAPEAVDATAASQMLAPTTQLKTEAAQATGAVHETLVAAPHTPLVQAKFAAPVVGAAVSDKTAVAPEAVDAAVALHTLAPTLQLRSPEQGAGAVQVALVGAPQTPLLQINVAAPVVGVTVSDTSALAPDAVDAALALQALAPTVQFNRPEHDAAAVSVVTPVNEVAHAAPVVPVTPLVPGAAKQLSHLTAFT